MRVASSKNSRIIRGCVILAIVTITGAIPVGILATALTRLKETVAFQYEIVPDESSFLQANYSRLEEMALYYDDRFERYHIPLNMSTDTLFKDDECTEVARYQFSDNTGQWTGLAITGFVFKYLAAVREGNETMKDDALRVIDKLLHGMSMQLAVPNGGLGSQFPGILARGWAGPQHRHLPGVEWYFSDDPRHHNGTGIYSDWRWRGYTSNDEFSGFYAGLAMVLRYVDVPSIQDLAKTMIDQVASYMLKTNFLGIDWNGGPTGVHQRSYFGVGGVWTLLVLKLASLAFPEKYGHLYEHYLAEEFYAFATSEGGEHETLANYYAYAFGYHIFFALLTLETREPLRTILVEKFNSSIASYTRYHRNPFFNIIRLAILHHPGENRFLERDVEDALTRYDCPYHFPDRKLGHAEVPADRPRLETIDALQDFINNDPLGAIYAGLFSEFRSGGVFYREPLTAEYMNGNIFIWEKNPFEYRAPEYNPRYEYASFAFSLVYWIGRAYGYLVDAGEGGQQP